MIHADANVSDHTEDDVPPEVDVHTPLHEPDTSDAAKDDALWTRRNDAQTLPLFSEPVGIVDPPPPNAAPIYYLRLFFVASFWDLLVTETNRYAAQYKAKVWATLGPHARFRSWKPVTVSEMKVFIALYLLSGLIYKPQLAHYWASDPVYNTPAFPAAMSRDRFLLILQLLHFSDNTAPGEDKVRKVRPLLSLLLDRFQSVYIPSQQIAIDKELVLFKGRLSFKQYIPNKRSRFGIKIYALCDVHSYYWNAQIYCGPANPPLPHHDVLGATGALTVHILSSLKNKGYHLYVDNFYTSVKLAEFLRSSLNTCICGTMRANRLGIPAELKNLNIPKNRYAYRRKGNLLLVKMTDKKTIFLCSTMHDASLVSTGKRTARNELKRRLKVNHDYNRFMGGIDKNDSMTQSYTALRKSYKWYKKLAFHLIEEAVHNAYIIYRQQPGKRLEHYAFILSVIKALLAEGGADTAAQEVGGHRLDGKPHFFGFLPATEKRKNPMRKCIVCTARGQRHETRYFCQTCANHPPLCVVGCSKAYHTQVNYA